MKKKIIEIIIIAIAFFLISACTKGTPLAGSPVIAAESTEPASIAVSEQANTPESSPSTVPSPSIVPSNTAEQTVAGPTTMPQVELPTQIPLQGFVAFIWNNLGMHCFQNDYSQFLILPPYNIFYAQVIRRGYEPSIVTDDLAADYSLPEQSDPTAHSNFWDYAAFYGWDIQPGIGLKGKGITGSLDKTGDHFVAEGVPVVDVNDDGSKNPYPFLVVEVKDSSGNSVANTVNVAPASTEMSCYLCHARDDPKSAFANILQSHDQLSNTSLLDQVKSGKPVLCNTCHADPAMSVPDNLGAQSNLSSGMHTFHADKMDQVQGLDNICYACHPGLQTLCLRDVMFSNGIVCEDCHGNMTDVGSPSRISWVNLPECTSCHTEALSKSTIKHIDNPNQFLTASSGELYQNSKAHGGGGIYCSACHGSPHAIYPTITQRDNEQSIRLQGFPGTIADCSVCHTEKPEEAFWHFDE